MVQTIPKAQTQFTGVRPSFLLYLGVMMIALLKDILDLAGIGSLPGIGTIVTLCFTFFIWMLLTLFDHSGGKSSKKAARGLVLVSIGLVEGIGFGLNFLPIETITVVLLYIMAKRAATKEEKRLAQEGRVQTNSEKIREYQRARLLSRQKEEEAANDEVYQQGQRA